MRSLARGGPSRRPLTRLRPAEGSKTRAVETCVAPSVFVGFWRCLLSPQIPSVDSTAVWRNPSSPASRPQFVLKSNLALKLHSATAMPIAMVEAGKFVRPVVADRNSHYRLEGKCCDRIVPLGFLIRVAHAWTPPQSTTARAIAVNSRLLKKNALLVRIRLYSKHSPDRGPMRKASRPRCSARAAAGGVARRRNAIPVGLGQSPRLSAETRRVLPATAWAGARSGGFGKQRDSLLPSLFWHSGQHGVIEAPEEV